MARRPGDKQADKDAGFLSRWSQRKRQAEQAAAREDAAPPAAADAAAGQPAEGEDSIDPRELPDVDSLEAGSDFTVFLRKGVPQALKQRALRRLWQVDPAFREICMLDDYNLDYTDAATVVPNLKTIYQVGRGMVLPGDDEVETQTGGDAPEPEQLEPAQLESEAPEESTQLADDVAPTVAAPPASPAGEPRKPRRPRMSPASGAATRQESQAPALPRLGARSARRRRWGDLDA